MELLIGCGSSRIKQLAIDNNHKWKNLITLDINKDHKPDIVWDLNNRPLPFKDNEFDEIHAYEILEHIGRQGDYKTFFEEFTEYWRILKDGGVFCFSVPKHDSIWAWGDPGHTRVINEGTLVFLDQDSYAQIGKTAMTDYRFLYKADFKIVHSQNAGEKNYFALMAKKGKNK